MNNLGQAGGGVLDRFVDGPYDIEDDADEPRPIP